MSTKGSDRRTGKKTDQFWARRYATCRTPAERAGAEWDRLRSGITKLDADQQDAAWRKIADRLAALRDDLPPAKH